MKKFSLAAAVSSLLWTLPGFPPAAASEPACNPPLFVQAESFPTGGDFGDRIAVGDFDNDDVPDLVTGGGGDVSVLLGLGDGAFGPPISSAFGARGLLVVEDFNSDGDLDLVIADNYVNVLLGNGDGIFEQGPTYFTESARDLVVGDFNGDGKADLAEITDFFGVELLILLGNGDGTFQTPVSYSSPLPTTLLAADFNGDGRSDLAGPLEFEIVITLSNPDGSPGLPSFLPVGSNMLGVLPADLDGDGELDLTVSRADKFEVFRGLGDGSFQAPVQHEAGGASFKLLAADVDGDGRTDLAGLRPEFGGGRAGAGVIDVWIQTATGDFETSIGYQAPFPIFRFASADFNGDGLADFVAPGGLEEARVAVFLAEPDRLRASRSARVKDEPATLVAGDFDRDGLDELVVIGRLGETLWILGNDRAGHFQVRTAIPYTGAGINASVAADFDRDGRLDLAIASFYGVLDILIGNGDGTFQPAVTYTIPIGPTSLALGDFDADGTPDLAATGGQTSPDDLLILLNTGDGTLRPAIPGPSHIPLSSLAAGDLNADGYADLVGTHAGHDSSFAVSIFLSQGDGSLQDPVDYFTGSGPSSVAIEDMDGDGNLDAVVSNAESTNVSVLTGDGQGGFLGSLVIGVGWSPAHLVVADFDSDGFPDIATANGGFGNGVSNTLSLLLGMSGGGFAAPVDYMTGANPLWVAAGNYLGVGAIDIASANQYGGSVSLFQGARLAASVPGQSVVVGRSVELKVLASGFGALSYQWRKGGVAIVDGGGVSGAETSVLKFASADFLDAGSYDVVVTDSCGSVASNVAVLSVEFADVPQSYPFHGAILKIAAAGITNGCGGGDYCPEDLVTRGQMAVFLLRGEHGAAYLPPPATGGVFGDVPADAPFARWIERVALEGITKGCGGANYCPEGLVARGEMAVFLLRAKHGGTYLPPQATGTVFSDVPADAPFARWIERLAGEGISSGCGGGKYCPNATVTRGEMAAFLARTFGL